MNIIAKDTDLEELRSGAAHAERKFSARETTLDGARRARVELTNLQNLWFNTGTLCNLTCTHCYIESSPSNDRLVYLTRDEVAGYLAEIAELGLAVEEIGFTGGEPFMNPDIIEILDDVLAAGFNVLMLTNAMRPMMKRADDLLVLQQRYGERLVLRISIDHYDQVLHQEERGAKSWSPMVAGLKWLAEHGFNLNAAARARWGDNETDMRAGFKDLFERLSVPIDALSPTELLLFPELDDDHEVPEITEDCWHILGVRPNDMMCATSRMVVKRRGALQPEVVACTLLPYESEFSLGASIAESIQPVYLNHASCAQFCVLGGGSCSA